MDVRIAALALLAAGCGGAVRGAVVAHGARHCVAAASAPHVQTTVASSENAAPVTRDGRPEILGALDAAAARVVACVGRSPVGVDATWGEDGNVRLEVQGEEPDGAESRCVRSVVGPVALTPRAAGEEIDVIASPS